MARPSPSNRRTTKEAARRGAKKKVCAFCQDGAEWVDYKDVNLLRRFMSERGKIRARRVSGNCAQHQREVAVAIKTARELALLPYTQRTVADRGLGRTRPPRGGPAEGAAPAEGVGEDLDLEQEDTDVETPPAEDES